MPLTPLPVRPAKALSQLAKTLMETLNAHLLYPEDPLPNSWIDGVCSDSRQVKPGSVFVALVGTAQGGGSNGHHYVHFAIETQQASAVIIQADQQAEVLARGPEKVLRQTPIFVVDNTYRAVAALSSQLANWPGHQLDLFGVLMDSHETDDPMNLYKHQALITVLSQTLAVHASHKVGQIGLDGFRVTGPLKQASYSSFWTKPVGHTPPWSEELQPLLVQMLHQGCQQAVLALHPLGLEQRRYLGCQFQGILSLSPNIKTFDWEEQSLPIISPENIHLTQQVFTHNGIIATVQVADKAPLSGLFPFLDADLLLIARLCIAMLLAIRPELALEEVLQSICGLQNAPLWQPWCNLHWLNRGEEQAHQQTQAQVLLDSASSPTQVKASLTTVRQMMHDGVFGEAQKAGRLWLVVGAPGDHHPEWRESLAKVLAEGVDQLVLTADNPRNELLDKINGEIMEAMPQLDSFIPVQSIADRGEAIQSTLMQAASEDVVLICGKGKRFTYQILPDGVYPWEDEAYCV